MKRRKIIIIVILVIILIIILLVVFKDKLFAANPKTISTINPSVNSGVFPLNQGTVAPEVGRLQTYLKAHGGKDCTGGILIVDNKFGPKTACAVLQVLNVSEVSQSLFNSLGL